MTQATLKNRVIERTTTTGIGAFALAGVPDVRYQTFLAAMGPAAVTYYYAVHEELNEWEIGVGIVNGDGTLTRSTVIRSTNANALVNFSAGTKEVGHDIPAEKLVALDTDTNKLTLPGQLSVAGLATLTGGFTGGASSSLSAGSDADTDLSIGGGGAAPTVARTASLTLNAPDSGSFRGAAKWLLKRAASLVWAVGLFSSVAGAMGAVTDLAFDPGTGTPVAALSSAGALTLSGALTVTSGGIAVTGNSTITGTLGGISNLSVTTVTSGAWQATPVVTTYGGTGLSSWTAGDLAYYAAGTTLSKLAIGANANVVLSQSGGVPAWTASPTISGGTDASTFVTFGTGGGVPTASRSVKLALNSPGSGSYAGSAYIEMQRAGVIGWRAGLIEASGGALSANTDYAWWNGSSYVAALTTAGQFRSASGFVTKAGAAASFGTVDNFALNFLINNATVGLFDISGNLLLNGASTNFISSPGIGIRTASANGTSTGLYIEQVNTGTSAGVVMSFGLADSTSVMTRSGLIQSQKSAAWTNGSAATFMSKMLFYVLDTNVLTTYLTLDANAQTITLAKPVLHPDGMGSLPSIAFSTTPGMGFYRIGASSLGVSTGVQFSVQDGLATVPSLNFVNAGSLGWYRISSTHIVMTSGSTDADATYSVGIGGAAPTANRAITLYLNAPSSGSFLGQPQIIFRRNTVDAGYFAHLTATAGAMAATSDLTWGFAGGAPVMALTTGGQLRLASGGTLAINANQVVGARKTGWATWTGTVNRATKDTATATLADVAQTLAALIADLHATAGHGLIGT